MERCASMAQYSLTRAGMLGGVRVCKLDGVFTGDCRNGCHLEVLSVVYVSSYPNEVACDGAIGTSLLAPHGDYKRLGVLLMLFGFASPVHAATNT